MSFEQYMPSLFLTAFGLVISYNIYRTINPTIDDLRYKKDQRDLASKRNLEIAESLREQDEWEERCLQAGKILPR